MIHINNLYKSFGERDILKGIDLHIRRGEVLFLMGGSGCGKSTIFKHLMGLYQPERGEVLINDRNIVGMTSEEFDEIRLQLGVLFQSSALLKSLTVEENIALPLRELTDMSEASIAEKVLWALDRVFLQADILSLKPDNLSGGMQKRVGLARAIIREPALILYDEPTTGLDPVIAVGIHELIGDLNKTLKVTSVVVSHDIPGALLTADRIAIVMDGKIAALGTPSEIESLTDPRIQAFLAAGQGKVLKKA